MISVFGVNTKTRGIEIWLEIIIEKLRCHFPYQWFLNLATHQNQLGNFSKIKVPNPHPRATKLSLQRLSLKIFFKDPQMILMYNNSWTAI